MIKNLGHTIVQHSAYGYNGDPQFIAGLETRRLSRAVDVKAVKAAGGLIFTGDNAYSEAEAFADNEMYPTGDGMIPHAEGTFSTDVKIDGLALYVYWPARTTKDGRYIVTIKTENPEADLDLLMRKTAVWMSDHIDDTDVVYSSTISVTDGEGNLVTEHEYDVYEDVDDYTEGSKS